MLADAYEEAKRMLSENREILDRIAAFLIEKETITGKEFMDILHRTQAELAGNTGAAENTASAGTVQASETEQGPVADTIEYPKYDI